MKDNWKSYLGIALIIGAFVAFNIFYKGPSDEEFEKAGIKILNESNYQTLMNDVERPLIILFKSESCNVCKVFSPKFIDFAKKNQGKAQFIVADYNKVDFDRFHVKAFPTTRAYYQGKIIEELVGNGSLSPFQKIIDETK
jgi:thiol-disulfide isomerase/thioredoxin